MLNARRMVENILTLIGIIPSSRSQGCWQKRGHARGDILAPAVKHLFTGVASS